MAYDWGPFLTYWGTYCKDVFQNALMGESKISFSEGLLRTLYYETDVGSIPRGISMDSRGIVAKFSSTENWNKQIQGCYWCLDDNITLNGICCGKDCLFFLHEWCIERVVHFTGDRFCRFPGCDNTSRNSIYCNQEHRARFDSAFPKWTDRKSTLKIAIRAGPSWYHENSSNTNNTPPQSKNLKLNTNITVMNELKMEDKGNYPIISIPVFTQCEGKIPLPKGYELQVNFTNENSDQQQQTVLNSNANQPMNSTDPFCDGFDLKELSEPVANKINPFISVLSAESTQRENPIQSPTRVGHMNEQVSNQFYETNTMQTSTESESLLLQPSYCETKFQMPSNYDCPFNLPRTDNLDTEPSPQIPTFANKLISLADAQVRNKIKTPRQEVEAATSVLTDPMYTAPNTNTRIDLRLQRSQSLIEQNPHQSSGLVLPDIYPFSLATKLTDMLSQYTDVGVIPRHRAPHTPAPREHATQSNWGARIVGCYWCELNNTSFHELTCSCRCWLLFHEWSVRKIETGCGTRMCALPGCENSRADGGVCCSFEHIRDLSELRGSASLSMEEEVEIILGPKWYSDLSPIHFSRTGAFYEFSNYFPSLLILEDSIWPTVYHYLCARKLVGTPYSNHISRMECVGELEMWMKRRTCGKWVRADWSRVWEGATYRSVFAKFQQNSVLRGLLLRTGRRPLVCRDSSLGDVLVGLRERFKTQRFFPTGQLEALINPACKSINNPTIVSKTSLVHSPSQDRESLPTEKSDKNNSEYFNAIPKDKELVSASGYDPVSFSD